MLQGEIGAAVPLMQGLTAWMQDQPPEMWYEFARGVQFDAPGATIDLLMTADWIVRQPECDRATALVLLLRTAQAGLFTSAPAGMDAGVTRAFCLSLHQQLAARRWPARWRISTAKLQLLRAWFGRDSQMPLPEAVLHGGHHAAHPAHVFAAGRPWLLARRLAA